MVVLAELCKYLVSVLGSCAQGDEQETKST
jgi:hypothetical protein